MTQQVPTSLRPVPPETVTATRDKLRGTVVLVGGGPGDPGLISLTGHDLVCSADVLLVDHLAPDLTDYLAPDCEVIDVAKLPYQKSVAQERINELLVQHAQDGKFVVRLKGGDPYVFGRGLEERQYCEQHGVTVHVVPGITSAISVPESVGVSVTHRGLTHEFTVVSGHVPPGHPKSLVNWDALAAMTGTICIIMGVKNGPAIAEALIAGGKDPKTPVQIIQEGTTPSEHTVSCTLDTMGEALQNIAPPAVIVIGAVVGLNDLAGL